MNKTMIPFRTDREKWIWLACAIDGEGSIYISKYRQYYHNHRWNLAPRYSPAIRVTNNVRAFVEQMRDIVGHGWITQHPPNTPRSHPFFCYQIKDARAADILRKILPFLVIKKRQAILALWLQRNVDRHRKDWRLPKDVISQRDEMWLRMKALTTRGKLGLAPARGERTSRQFEPEGSTEVREHAAEYVLAELSA